MLNLFLYLLFLLKLLLCPSSYLGTVNACSPSSALLSSLLSIADFLVCVSSEVGVGLGSAGLDVWISRSKSRISSSIEVG